MTLGSTGLTTEWLTPGLKQTSARPRCLPANYIDCGAQFRSERAGTGKWRWAIERTPARAWKPPDYGDSSARRDHQASAAVIALSAWWMSVPTSPAVAAQCKGTRARAPGSQWCSSGVSGSGAVLS
jgi:hypothetical protein